MQLANRVLHLRASGQNGRDGERNERGPRGGWQGANERAVSAKDVLGLIGTRSAQSETSVRVAAERRAPDQG